MALITLSSESSSTKSFVSMIYNHITVVNGPALCKRLIALCR